MPKTQRSLHERAAHVPCGPPAGVAQCCRQCSCPGLCHMRTKTFRLLQLTASWTTNLLRAIRSGWRCRKPARTDFTVRAVTVVTNIINGIWAESKRNLPARNDCQLHSVIERCRHRKLLTCGMLVLHSFFFAFFISPNTNFGFWTNFVL